MLGYGRRTPDAPFPRNLNFVVAFLLAVLGLDREEDVFWILAALLEQCLHPSCVLEVSLLALCLPLCRLVVELHSLYQAVACQSVHG